MFGQERCGCCDYDRCAPEQERLLASKERALQSPAHDLPSR
jgi:hypothetical protein